MDLFTKCCGDNLNGAGAHCWNWEIRIIKYSCFVCSIQHGRHRVEPANKVQHLCFQQANLISLCSFKIPRGKEDGGKVANPLPIFGVVFCVTKLLHRKYIPVESI